MSIADVLKDCIKCSYISCCGIISKYLLGINVGVENPVDPNIQF